MTKFNYKARDQLGTLVSGMVEADDQRAVALQLERQKLIPLAINPINTTDFFARAIDWYENFQRVKLEELIVFTRQMAAILQAGVPLTEGLDAVHEQIRNRKFRLVVADMKAYIEGGATFSDALEKNNRIFSPLIINMVRAGEKAGILDEVLDSISNLLDKELETTNKIKNSTRYPLIVISALGIAFIILTTFVIPRFAYFFSSFKTELPLPTRILIWINHFIVNYWYWIVGLIFFGIYFLKKYLDTERGRYSWDRFILSIPVFGPLFSRIYLSRFARMLAAMMGSGIPVLEALLISSATVENKIISRVILDIRDEVAKGKSLSEPMRHNHIFPPIATAMVAIGEKAGTLENMLNRVADYFDREADYTIKNLTPLLEPILIAGLGLIVLLFALGIFLPMWDLVRIYKNF